MGIEESEGKALSEKELKERLQYLISIWDFDTVVSVLRKIKEEKIEEVQQC